MKIKIIKKLAAAVAAMSPLCSWAQNPYMPLWEYIPDGEPYVFEDPDKPGEMRVYVYGSHDNIVTDYCGRDQVAWSAPVNDLSNWRYDGVIFKSLYGSDGRLLNSDASGDVLFAPDVAVRQTPSGKKEYFLFPNVQSGGRNGLIAKSDRPDGPFTVCNWSKDNPAATYGIYGFDPAVFVDDDGRVYGYWGFEKSFAAEIDPATMCTVKPGTQVVSDMVSSYKQPGEFRFFEASSMRKILDKYVFIYSRYTGEGEFGLPSVNYTLAYAYSDNPLGPWTYGGTIIDGRARGTDKSGKPVPTANPYGNTHGSICEINGQWWVFYHRQTGTDEYSRQAMAAPITVKVQKGKGGKVEISEGEYTSEGFMTQGLDPFAKSMAGWACYLTNPSGVAHEYPYFRFTGSYVEATRPSAQDCAGAGNCKMPLCPVVNNTSGSVVGFKYFNFAEAAKLAEVSLVCHFMPEGVDGTIDVLVGGPSAEQGGTKIGEFSISKDSPRQIAEYAFTTSALKGVAGKQPLFFAFKSAQEGKSVCQFFDFRFAR